ncbi:MAG: hypothetical protein KatS3mg091_159 [Patescibacteria group bacterium]|nr:MAG: hypothetical protein KatS3mg091_159 [Patescibacteria group bacterium]
MKSIFNLISNIYFLVKNKSLPGSLVIVCKENRGKKTFLLVKSAHSNAITFPSGNLDPCEDFFEAAIRELFEETGLKIKKDNLLLTPLIHSFKYKNLPFQIKSQQRVFFLLLTTKINYLNPQDKDIEWARWYNLDKTLSLLSYPELKLTFKKAVKYLKRYDQRI